MGISLRERVNNRLDSWARSFTDIAGYFLAQVGLISQFGWYSLRLFFVRPFRGREFIQQIEFIGNQSIFIIVLTGIFTGMALSFQVWLGFRLINAAALVGPTVAMGITRELGPVLSGLIVAARAGGAMAANIGSMRVTEQIDALEVMGVNPVQYLVSPRIWASIISLPLLTAIFDFVAMVGCYILCVRVLGMDEAIFWDKTVLWLEPSHINEGLFKAVAFGLVFSTICSYKGYNAKGGARAVGEATNSGVVISMVMIVILDFFLMNIIDVYYKVMG